MTDQPVRVLLVEDDPGDIRLISEMLASSRAAESAIECVQPLVENTRSSIVPGLDPAEIEQAGMSLVVNARDAESTTIKHGFDAGRTAP